MNKFLKIFPFATAALIFILAACGDDHLVDTESNILRQYVFAGPDGYNSEISNRYDPVDEIYVEQGQTLRFYAGYSAGGPIYTDETLQPYYSGLLWKIDDNSFNLNSFRFTFQNPGVLNGSLETTDLFGDTLRSTFKIYVNTPNGIALEFPYNGYNQAEPTDDQSLPLRWSVTGIDPWETARCEVYVSYDPDSVWQSPLGATDCLSEASIMGSLVQEFDSIAQEEIDLYDSSFTLYWGAKMRVTSASGREYHDSTEIFHFSTKILNRTSTVKIPFTYDRYRDNSILQTIVYLIASNGDTLETLTSDRISNTLVAKVEPQLGLKILLKESYRKEYASESLIVDIPAYTVLTTDTIVLKDRTAPQIAVLHDTIGSSDDIQFLLYDDGSGINESKLSVIVDFDTIQPTYNVPTLSFRARCFGSCKIEILGEDNARNKFPDVHWIIDNKSSYRYILGPYPNREY